MEGTPPKLHRVPWLSQARVHRERAAVDQGTDWHFLYLQSKNTKTETRHLKHIQKWMCLSRV